MFWLLKWKRGKKLLLKTVRKVERSWTVPLEMTQKFVGFSLLWAQIMHGSMEPHFRWLRRFEMEFDGIS